MNERIEKFLDSIDVNPKIRELAEKSGCSIDKLGFGEGNLEKFAELIVREFASKIERDYKYERGEDTKWIVAFAIANDLKAHFGVEE